jgi:transposase
MARRQTKLVAHRSAEQLRHQYRSCREAKEARRWHALWLLSQGQRTEQVARSLGMSGAWVRRVRQRYNAEGPEGVREGHQHNPGGRQPYLTPRHQQRLSKVLERPPQDGGLWTGSKVAAWIEAQTGRKTYAQLGCVYLRRLGLSPQVPRRRHAQAASPEQRRVFKESSGGR